MKEFVESNNQELIFAVNGRMNNNDQSLQGLFVEKGIVRKEVDVHKEGFGNFYLKPNGVFCLTKDGKGIVRSMNDFKLDSTIEYATQSGPMLLINGDYNNKLIKRSLNLHIGNGVGILPNGNVLFAMSKERVNFYDLAILFRQK